MGDLDLRLIRYFVATADELHFGRAAARLFISQQTLSSQIAKLELDLGVALFDRTGRQVRLTHAGQQLLVEGRALLEQAQRSLDVVRASRQVVRVASINDRIDTVPRILDTCGRMFPDLQVEAILAPVPEQVRLVQSGALDVALGRAYRLPVGLSAEVFRLDRAHVVALRDHPLGNSDAPLTWRALGTQAVQVPPAQYAPQLVSFLDALRLERHLRFQITPTGSTSLELSLAQLAREAGVQLGFDSFRVPGEQAADRLMIEPVALYVWSAIWRAGNPSPALRTFLEAIRAASAELGWMRPAASLDVWVPEEDVGSWLPADIQSVGSTRTRRPAG